MKILQLMLRLLFLAGLCLPGYAAIAYDNGTVGVYTGSGTNTLSWTASGTNLVCIGYVWHRSGTISAVTCNGHAMTLGPTHTFTQSFTAVIDTYIYAGSLSAGTMTFSISASVESALMAWSANGAAQTGQPDATAAFVTGAESGMGLFNLPITTVANNSLVAGLFNTGDSTSSSPTSNATFRLRITDSGIDVSLWTSTLPITPAGSINLVYAGGSSGGSNVDANGISLAPPAGAVVVANQSVFAVGSPQ